MSKNLFAAAAEAAAAFNRAKKTDLKLGGTDLDYYFSSSILGADEGEFRKRIENFYLLLKARFFAANPDLHNLAKISFDATINEIKSQNGSISSEQMTEVAARLLNPDHIAVRIANEKAYKEFVGFLIQHFGYVAVGEYDLTKTVGAISTVLFNPSGQTGSTQIFSSLFSSEVLEGEAKEIFLKYINAKYQSFGANLQDREKLSDDELIIELVKSLVDNPHSPNHIAALEEIAKGNEKLPPLSQELQTKVASLIEQYKVYQQNIDKTSQLYFQEIIQGKFPDVNADFDAKKEFAKYLNEAAIVINEVTAFYKKQGVDFENLEYLQFFVSKKDFATMLKASPYAADILARFMGGTTVNHVADPALMSAATEEISKVVGGDKGMVGIQGPKIGHLQQNSNNANQVSLLVADENGEISFLQSKPLFFEWAWRSFALSKNGAEVVAANKEALEGKSVDDLINRGLIYADYRFNPENLSNVENSYQAGENALEFLVKNGVILQQGMRCFTFLPSNTAKIFTGTLGESKGFKSDKSLSVSELLGNLLATDEQKAQKINPILDKDIFYQAISLNNQIEVLGNVIEHSKSQDLIKACKVAKDNALVDLAKIIEQNPNVLSLRMPAKNLKLQDLAKGVSAKGVERASAAAVLRQSMQRE